MCKQTFKVTPFTAKQANQSEGRTDIWIFRFFKLFSADNKQDICNDYLLFSQHKTYFK